MTAASFTAWQILSKQGTVEMPFGTYLEELGLKEPAKMTAEDVNITASTGIRILDRLRKKK